MARYPRGSEWRKWDLHLHVPGTKLGDAYGSDPNLSEVCRVIAESDVAVFGVTDYFSFDSYHRFVEQFNGRYPDSNKAFFPNLELRLNEAVNKELQNVNLHLIFRPSLPNYLFQKFLSELKTEIIDSRGRAKSCAELQTAADYESATVTRTSVTHALDATFGKREHWNRDVLAAVPANNDGIRADSGVSRKANLADQIDRFSSIVFGSQKNVDYFLRTDRFEDGTRSTPKPVLSGCDAHSLEHLESRLGKTVKEDGFEIEPTWVKADPTFDGLLQTLIEPKHRVRIQATRPDAREPYQYISKVRFSAIADFPKEIELNSNLVSIIGARSSGKSSLLAYIAHAVDPEHVIEQQVAARGIPTEKAGPAAGKTWNSVQHIDCSVEWGDEATKSGRIIYIPQNSLYAISERPNEITAKIEPAVHRMSPDFAMLQRQTGRDIDAQNVDIEQAVASWFSTQASVREKERAKRDVGDRQGIERERDKISAQIATLRDSSKLTPDELDQYSAFLEQESSRKTQIREAEEHVAALDGYLAGSSNNRQLTTRIAVEVDVRPALADYPPELRRRLEDAIEAVAEPLRSQVESLVVGYRAELESALHELHTASTESRTRHSDLVAKNSANSEIDELVRRRQKQEEALAEIASIEREILTLNREISSWESAVVESIAKRGRILNELKERFQEDVPVSQSGMIFGLEAALPSEAIEIVSRAFNLRDRSEYVDRDRSGVRIGYAQNQPVAFMAALWRGDQKLRQGEDAQAAATRVLTATPQLRFYASLDGDRIGGFEPSSMTPGKQALFALTLILDESDEPWPLLIDQPEDDLDSRSVYDQIVPYLVHRKQERQILMVTHNANLVVGADSEQVIVSNRHGDDRKNPNLQTFCYFSGSLEHSAAKNPDAEFILDSCGVREHACDLLDGGSDAFRKRMEKYNIDA